MKKYCFLFVFLVAALSLRAQIVGDVAVTRKVLAERAASCTWCWKYRCRARP